MNKSHRTMLALGYLGLIPFIVALLMGITDIKILSITGEWLFIAYSVVILSFLSGVIWGRHLSAIISAKGATALMLSNAFALFAWLAILSGQQRPAFAILLLGSGYVSLLLAERWLERRADDTTPTGYTRMRQRLTALVTFAHGLMLVA